MLKTQFLVVTWNSTLTRIVKEIKAFTFDEKNTLNFRLERITDQSINGNFIERKKIIKKIFDESHNEKTVEYFSFIHTFFTLNESFPQMEIVQPPRSIKNFLNIISEFSDFRVAIFPLKIDLRFFIENAIEQLNDFSFSSVQCNNLFNFPDLKSKLFLDGKNITNIVTDFPDAKLYKIGFSCNVNHSKYNFELSEKGLLIYDELCKETEIYSKIIHLVSKCNRAS